ncbi:MAG: alcohol dehydrogenase catalytic domain-containing protein [Chloroflexi bacterium]|nr:alcohol dehydrogenase catalytic domain-containing protein [Chloroflexota bacterium]
MRLKAAVCYAPRDIRIEHEEIERLGPGDVRVNVAYCGVCPWDLRVYLGLSSSVHYPLHMGHELSGVVTETGAEVHGLRPGDRVCVDAIRRCGTCSACTRGLENHCANADFSRGGFATHITAPASNVYPLRDSTPLLHAALTEPLACILRAQSRLALQKGTTALVLGCGPLGLLHLQALISQGMRVLVSDPLPQRRNMALALGASVAFAPSSGDLAVGVNQYTDGWGVEAAIVATGAVAAAEEALPLLAFDGKMILFAGIHPRANLVLDPNAVHYRETWITGSSDYTRAEFMQSLELIQRGELQLTPLITDIFALDHIAEALAAVQSGERLKVVVQCNPDLDLT